MQSERLYQSRRLRAIVGVVLVLAMGGCASLAKSPLPSRPSAASAEATLGPRADYPVARSGVTISAVPTPRADAGVPPADAATWVLQPIQPLTRAHAADRDEPSLAIDRRLQYAFDLADRGATYSAAAEFRAVLAICALKADEEQGANDCREALRDALTALQEADDFIRHRGDLERPLDVRRIAQNHRTRALPAKAAGTLTPYDALDAYYAYAENRLVESVTGRQASLALYGLGKTQIHHGMNKALTDAKAMLLYRAALRVEPENYLAANELAVLLAKHGHLARAEHTLRECLRRSDHPAAYENLATVCDWQGKSAEARRIRQHYQQSIADRSPDVALVAQAVSDSDEGIRK